MRKIYNILLFLTCVSLIGACQKEDYTPKDNDNTENCGCSNNTDGKTGGSSASSLDCRDTEDPITDPNNDEDENVPQKQRVKN